MNSLLKNKVAITPRPYLSWSQLLVYERSPKEYIQIYLYGKKFENEATRLGSKLADALEDLEKDSGNEALEFLKIIMPTKGVPEFEIEADLEGIPLFGKLDRFHEESMSLREVKSGKKWTQKMVDELGQITFYCLLIWLKYRKFPNEIVLDWVPTTRGKKGELVFTCEPVSFATTRTMKDLVVMAGRIKQAWEGIQKLIKEEQAKIF